MWNTGRAKTRASESHPAGPDAAGLRAPGRASGGTSGALGPGEFSTLLSASHGRMWLIAAAVLGNRTEADDVVQEAALIALGKLGEFSCGTSFDAWMGQIVRNVARNAGRKRARRHALDLGAAGREGASVGAGELVNGVGKLDGALMDGLETLDETARVCLLLRVVGELPYRSIAAIADIPEGTAMSHVHRSRERLRRWMVDRGLGPDSPDGRQGGSA